MKIEYPFFLKPEEKTLPVPLLLDTVTTVTMLFKKDDAYSLRIVDMSWKAVLPLGSLIVPLPLRITVENEFGKPIPAVWGYHVALGSTDNAYSIVDLRPDQVAYVV